MSLDAIQGGLGIYAGTFVICFLSGLIPVINAEIYLIAVLALAGSPALAVTVTLLAALGQMVAKVLLFFSAQGVLSLPLGRYQAKLERARGRVERWKQKPLLVTFASASLGLPPFYVVSLLAGALEIRFWPFITVGFAGRVLRFGVVALIPLLLNAWHVW